MSNSPIKYIIYTGPSMNPTLKTGDMLYVVPYNKDRKVQRGDVVVFLTPAGGRRITHRVISIDSGIIRTRGDNNSKVDNYILRHDNLVGRVVYAFRKKRRLRIYGGGIGRLFAMTVKALRKIRLYRRIRLYVFPLLRPVYHHLVKSGILRRYIFPYMKTKIVSFNRPEGIERQLLMGQRVIGRCAPGSAQWQIKLPFRLLVDVALPPQEEPKYN